MKPGKDDSDPFKEPEAREKSMEKVSLDFAKKREKCTEAKKDKILNSSQSGIK